MRGVRRGADVRTSAEAAGQVNRRTYLAVVIGVALGAATAACLAPSAEEQTKSASKPGTAPRTAWGDPDLRGVWTGSSITPLERPEEFAGREFLTEAEAAAIEERAARDRVDRPPKPGDPGTYNQIWFDPASRVVPTRRTSLIVDPPDGRLPFTEEGRRHQIRSSARYGVGPRDSWVDLDTGERCLTDGMPLPYWTGYNNNYQLFQSRDYVVILAEMFRDRRIIPLDGRSHGSVPQWLGDSRGRWEGDTLVVETTGVRRQGALLVGVRLEGIASHVAPDGTLHACRRGNDRLPVHDGRPGDVYAAVDGGISADDESGVTRCDGGAAVPVRLPRGELRSPERPGWSPGEGRRRRKRRAEGIEVMHARLIGTIACALLAATALPGCQARPAASTEAGREEGLRLARPTASRICGGCGPTRPLLLWNDRVSLEGKNFSPSRKRPHSKKRRPRLKIVIVGTRTARAGRDRMDGPISTVHTTNSGGTSDRTSWERGGPRSSWIRRMGKSLP